ncbi:MAG: aldo/keto reductase [Chloroflexi bacterium]|nr:aldo/keto reductase [Chloroflexota bacterium]
MDKRRLGRTEHRSTIAIFGAAALSDVTQAVADRAMRQVIDAGINHIDVAPSYGNAEERLGPWLAKERGRFFLGCKTIERKKEAAAAELQRSLERLQVDSFDLYQAHAVNNMEELDKVTAPGGALEAMIEAREQGLTRFIGMTGHGVDSPAVFLEALRRFDFDTVLFPINFVQYANPEFRGNAEALLQVCREREIGSMIIKAICRAPWGELSQTYTTWYQPFEQPDEIQAAVDFSLSSDVTGLCTAGDVRLLPMFIEACEKFQPMDDVRREALIATASQYEPLFV